MKLARIVTRLRSRGGAFAHDALMIPVAWLGALWLRFNLGTIPAEFLEQALLLLPLIVTVQSLVFLYFGLYRGVWRFASMPDLIRILQAVVVGVSLCAVGAFLLTRLAYTPRASFPLFAGLLVALLGGPRLAYRWLKDRRFLPVVSGRMLIVGAGRAGETLVRDLLRAPSREYRPVGFVDDDPEKKGRDVQGVRILGHCGRIPEFVARTGAEVIAIAIPSANAAEMRRVVELCERAHVPIRTVPRIKEPVPAAACPPRCGRSPSRICWTGRRCSSIGPPYARN